ncbi:DeoR/GlpR family DNA-binding transcription regulator [Alkalihalobacillus hemicellulosilyticus]|uniref:Transcriptional regulator of sugar metabolism n=1 Tax=Halalkalibacter hemicellulosilyticusJCM 9152 TaxID=1236971 RepID=W4QHS3_9BACI|nr:DeoR/GlpR family DNA-binding transcription regulator [Halalkalibacter hemicellulosilyticus]GAE30879.1 transcriptional regulator of sugar metabolism [Halalkalibacter hemicellulosilyticusJCM 9152]
MHSVERFEAILHELEKKKIVKVSELSQLLGVTEKTIRIDLVALEEKGLLKRIHGGAVLHEESGSLFPIKERKSKYNERKLNLSEAALTLIKPNETILLDGGSTTRQLANLLGDFPVTVITNDITIAYELMNKELVQLMVLGGTRIGTSSSLFGVQASDLLKRIRVNRLFIGATGVSIEHGLTVLNSFHIEWKRQILQCADQVTLVADSTKFEKVGLIQFAQINDVNEIVTDHQLDVHIRKEIEQLGVSVLVGN